VDRRFDGVQTPPPVTAVEMERCATIIIEGEAIEKPESLKTWLPRSLALAVVREGEEIVGVGVIKPARFPYAPHKREGSRS
jgi:hypothetical protein